MLRGRQALVPTWMERILPIGRKAAFEGRFRGTPFLRSWIWIDDVGPDGPAIVSRTDLDLAPLGLGDVRKRSEVLVILGPEGDPQSVTIEAEGGTTRLDVAEEGVTITLPDGARSAVPGPRPAFVLENNHPGHTALLAAAFTGPVASLGKAVPVLLPSSAAIIDYRPSVQEDGTLLSPFGERIEMVAGRIRHLATEDGSVEIFPSDEEMPETVPDAPAAPRYAAPADATFRLEELTTEGVHGPLRGSVARPARSSGVGVLVLQGSGSVDRDGFAGGIDTGTHAFADALAEIGATVLRYDKRGTGQSSTGDETLGVAGYEDAVEDAARCLAALQDDAAVEAGRVAILGHSLGGLTALVLSVERHAGRLPLALLAPPGRPLLDVMRQQVGGIARSQGLTETAIDTRLGRLDAFARHLADDADWPPDDPMLAATRIHRRSFTELAAYDPRSLIARQRAPVLICQGTHDVQMDVDADAMALARAAEAADVPVRCVLLDGLNHLFREAPAGEGLAGYAEIRPVSPSALDTVIDWLAEEFDLSNAT